MTVHLERHDQADVDVPELDGLVLVIAVLVLAGILVWLCT